MPCTMYYDNLVLPVGNLSNSLVKLGNLLDCIVYCCYDCSILASKFANILADLLYFMNAGLRESKRVIKNNASSDNLASLTQVSEMSVKTHTRNVLKLREQLLTQRRA